MPAASFLPHDIHPYIVMMGMGMMIGIFGHLSRSRWLVAIGILLVFLATVLFPLAVNVSNDQPQPPPGPIPPP